MSVVSRHRFAARIFAVAGRACAVAMVAFVLWMPYDAHAQVVVTISGDTALATISLPNPPGPPVVADVSIMFDNPTNLTAANLNLTAEIVDPNDAALRARLPLGTFIDPAFPVLITVEPISIPHLFRSSFDGAEGGSGNLVFENAYTFEIHTHHLVYAPGTPYRLFKSPVGGAFSDISSDVLNGSVRGRGRTGGFSQFTIANDPRPELIGLPGLGVPVIALGKLVVLEARIGAAAISDVLRLDLLRLLANVNTALLSLDYATAILNLDLLLAQVHASAGVDMPNVWRAERDLVNDAGDIDGQASSLRYSIIRLQGSGP